MLDTLEAVAQVAAVVYTTPVFLLEGWGLGLVGYHSFAFRSGTKVTVPEKWTEDWTRHIERGGMSDKELLRHAKQIGIGYKHMRWAPLWPLVLMHQARKTRREAQAMVAKKESEAAIEALRKRAVEARKKIDDHNVRQKRAWVEEFRRNEPAPKKSYFKRDKFGGRDVMDLDDVHDIRRCWCDDCAWLRRKTGTRPAPRTPF